jgi:UDP-N-acetylmuramoyl-tripeptide--D-alanyl-D-alanine ligase
MLTLADLIEGLAGRRPSNAAQPLRHFVIDSRAVQPNDVFIAFRGEKTDGHLYVADAFSRGAVAAIVEQDVSIEALLFDLRFNVTQRAVKQWTLPVIFRVDDSMLALQELAKWWRSRLTQLRVIGITGSVGKSSTKELVATVLERDFVLLKNEGNLNNEIGLPLTLLELEPKHERAVLEMGMYALGEIKRLAELAQPIVGVITNVGPVHLERMGTIETIAAAKSELVQALPASGTAILNFDDLRVRAMRDLTRAKVLTYGLDPQADLWADEIVSEGLEGIHFALHFNGEEFHVQVPLLGRHSVHTSLRAAAVGLAEGMSWDHILEGLQDRRAQLRLVAVPGPNGSTILDDSYNASPASMFAALNLLAELGGRKIAVLGDMLELGEYEDEGHRMVGLRAIDAADVLITVGGLGQMMAREAVDNGMSPERVKVCRTNEEAIEYLNTIVQPGDMILIKGSRGLHMEDIVNALVRG